MQGNTKVIEYLNFLLAGELAARDQYFIHAEMYDDMGLPKLFEHIDHEREHETEHAKQLICRILMLDGTPNMQVGEINIGKDVEDMLRKDLEVEYAVRQHLCDGIKLCEDCGDYVTRDMLVVQLKDTEEDHAYWLEKQIGLIEKVGIQNYLQMQAA